MLAEDAADVQIPANRRFHQLEVDRGGADLQSRVADNLYWLGRYIERLDNDARLLRTTATRVAQGVIGVREGIELRLLGKLIDQADLMPGAGGAGGARERRLPAGPRRRRLGPRRPRHGARRDPAPDRHAARPLLGRHDDRRRPAAERGAQRPARAPAATSIRCSPRSTISSASSRPLSGLASENMTRGTGWLFLDLGRRIERAQFVLRSALGPLQQSPIDWDAAMRLALELCDSSITYRWRYLGQLQPAPVLDLVVLDDSNPRAFAFQMRSIASHLDRLAEASGTQSARTHWNSLDSRPREGGRAVRRRGDVVAPRGAGARPAARDRVERPASARGAQRGDHARLVQPRAGGAGGRLDGVNGGNGGQLMHYLLSHRTTYSYASSVD